MNHIMAVVVSCVDAPELAKECTMWLRTNTSPDTIIILLDNGSVKPLSRFYADRLIRFDVNIGGNAVFHQMIPHLDKFGVDFVAYIHCDVMVREENWDQRVIAAFNYDPKLALIGFVGSNELDEKGGRGGGTMLNYLGSHYLGFGTSTTAEQHGTRVTELRPAAVLDHMTMIFRLSILRKLPPQEGNYAPGHFYDRICCAECVQQGYHVAYLGISCDHFSGGVAGGMASQLEVYKRWLAAEELAYDPNRIDTAVYMESERRFLHRFRDGTYKMVPYKVKSDYSVDHYNLMLGNWIASTYEFKPFVPPNYGVQETDPAVKFVKGLVK